MQTSTAARLTDALAHLHTALLSAAQALEQPGADPARLAPELRDLARTIEPARAIALPKLTVRRRQTLELVARGLSNKEIARHLGVTPPRAKQLVSELLALSRTTSRSALAAWAVARGVPHA